MTEADLKAMTAAMKLAKEVHALMMAASSDAADAEASGDFAGVVLIALNLVRDIEYASRETP